MLKEELEKYLEKTNAQREYLISYGSSPIPNDPVHRLDDVSKCMVNNQRACDIVAELDEAEISGIQKLRDRLSAAFHNIKNRQVALTAAGLREYR